MKSLIAIIEETIGKEFLPDVKTLDPKSIAKLHDVDVVDIEKELEMGIEVEKEHTKDDAKAREIALDHLKEFPDYYTRLADMEKKAEK